MIAQTPTDIRIPVREHADVAIARKHVRELAREAGMRLADVEALVTATSEIAANILVHAGSGHLAAALIDEGGRGVAVIARDDGPGIADVEQALQDGYTTAGGLGLGLAGARRLVDEFELHTEAGHGTTITLKKWVR